MKFLKRRLELRAETKIKTEIFDWGTIEETWEESSLFKHKNHQTWTVKNLDGETVHTATDRRMLTSSARWFVKDFNKEKTSTLSPFECEEPYENTVEGDGSVSDPCNVNANRSIINHGDGRFSHVGESGTVTTVDVCEISFDQVEDVVHCHFASLGNGKYRHTSTDGVTTVIDILEDLGIEKLVKSEVHPF